MLAQGRLHEIHAQGTNPAAALAFALCSGGAELGNTVWVQCQRSRQMRALPYGHGLAALGIAPPPLQELALEMFSRKASAVATNVPGPQQALYMAGCALRDLMFWVPQTGSIGLGLSILSYSGQVHFGLIADARLIPDPDAVIRRFGEEFDKLLYLAMMGRWDAPLDADAAQALLQDATVA